jgi:hypothetical protein
MWVNLTGREVSEEFLSESRFAESAKVFKALKMTIVLWYVDPLLGNDREKSSYTTVAEKRLRKQVYLRGNSWKQ